MKMDLTAPLKLLKIITLIIQQQVHFIENVIKTGSKVTLSVKLPGSNVM